MEIDMRTLLAALMVTTAFAFPASARTATERPLGPAADSQIYAQGRDSVYVGGEYRGTDPDPDVRLELRRESPHGGD
jgi:hypothetical protein